MQIIAILAMTDSLLIGSENGLPWHIPEDMKRFRDLTMGSVVIMGRNTYFSLPEKFRPLPLRRNIVLSGMPIEGVQTFGSIDLLLDTLQDEEVEKVFIIGGASVYDQFFEKNLVNQVELTIIHGDYSGDMFVKEFRNSFTEYTREEKENCIFLTLNHL